MSKLEALKRKFDESKINRDAKGRFAPKDAAKIIASKINGKAKATKAKELDNLTEEIFNERYNRYKENGSYKYLAFDGGRTYKKILETEGREAAEKAYLEFMRKTSRNLAEKEYSESPEKNNKKESDKQKAKLYKSLPQNLHPLVESDVLNIQDIKNRLVQKHVSELSKLPSNLIKKIANSDIKIYLGNSTITGLDGNGHMKGVRPRGWTEGDTWDMVAGGYNRLTKSVCAGIGVHGSTSLVLHELGHSLGHVFNHDHDRELNQLHIDIYDKLDPYLQQGGKGGYAGKEELLAEGFANVIMNKEHATKKYGQDFVNYIERKVLNVNAS